MWQHWGTDVVLQVFRDTVDPAEDGLKSQVDHIEKVMIIYVYDF